MSLNEAQRKVTEFLSVSDDTQLEHMHMDMSSVPPVLVYKNGEKFVAFDPASSRFFIDPNYRFSYEFNFNSLPEIQTKIDRWGKTLMDKAKTDYVQKWLENMSL